MEKTARSPAAILFDFDGVIIDSESIHHRAFDIAFCEIGLPPVPFPVYATHWSNGYWRDYAERQYPGVDLVALKRRKDELFLSLLDQGAPMIPGIDETIAMLAERWPLVLATGTARAPTVLVIDRLRLAGHFTALVTREDYAREKPAPDAFLCAASRAGVAPRECLAIEDSYKGLRAANAAAVPCVVIPNAYTSGADFSSASACLAMIGELSAARVEEIHRAAVSTRQ